MNDLYSRLDSSSSPIARITKNSITPMIRYTSRIDGPARLIVLPEPMNRPVPIAPPMAISCKCRLERLRRRCSGCCCDVVMCCPWSRKAATYPQKHPLDQRASSHAIAPRQPPPRAHEVAGIALRIVLKVVLVLRLGLPEIARWRHFGDHLGWPEARRIHVGDGLQRHLALHRGGVEDRRPIRAAHVVALPVRRARIVDLEEKLQQLPITHKTGIEGDLDGFGVLAMLAIGGVGRVATAIADARGQHSGLAADQVLHAP